MTCVYRYAVAVNASRRRRQALVRQVEWKNGALPILFSFSPFFMHSSLSGERLHALVCVRVCEWESLQSLGSAAVAACLLSREWEWERAFECVCKCV